MRNILISFFAGLVLGIAFMLLLPLLTVSDYPISKTKNEAKSLEKQVTQSEIVYAKQADSLQIENTKLDETLNSAKAELQKAKQKNYSLQMQVYDLLDKRYEARLDTSETNDVSCDSLVTTVEYLMQSSAEKDSLYETVTTNLESQLKNKDSTITLKERQYGEIKSAFSKSIEAQTGLVNQNNFLDKQIRKQKLKSKVLSAALFILSGAAANYFIHH